MHSIELRFTDGTQLDIGIVSTLKQSARTSRLTNGELVLTSN